MSSILMRSATNAARGKSRCSIVAGKVWLNWTVWVRIPPESWSFFLKGHTDSVTCAFFSRSDQIVSGSDDRSVKVWDLRNMRAPVTSIQTASPVNKLSVSVNGGFLIRCCSSINVYKRQICSEWICVKSLRLVFISILRKSFLTINYSVDKLSYDQ